MTVEELAALLVGMPGAAKVIIYGSDGNETILAAWTLAITKDGARLVLGREDYYS